MGLTNKKEEQLRKMPSVESRITRSKDGRFLVHKTIITDIKPVEYYKVVMESTVEEHVEDLVEKAQKAEA